MRLNLGTVSIGLSPAALEMTAFDWRGRAVRNGRAPLDGETHGWKGAVAGLREQFKNKQWQAGAARVVLSSHFVRYCLIPAELQGNAAEQASYVRHMFRGEYGEAVNGWRIATDEAAIGPRLACAVDAALFDELAAACRETGVRLRSVLPRLVASANAGRVVLREPAAWLAVLEGNLCIAALLEDGRWRHVARLRLPAVSGAAILKALGEQEILIGGEHPVRNVHLGGVARDLMRDTEGAGWSIGFLPEGGARA